MISLNGFDFLYIFWREQGEVQVWNFKSLASLIISQSILAIAIQIFQRFFNIMLGK